MTHISATTHASREAKVAPPTNISATTHASREACKQRSKVRAATALATLHNTAGLASCKILEQPLLQIILADMQAVALSCGFQNTTHIIFVNEGPHGGCVHLDALHVELAFTHDVMLGNDSVDALVGLLRHETQLLVAAEECITTRPEIQQLRIRQPKATIADDGIEKCKSPENPSSGDVVIVPGLVGLLLAKVTQPLPDHQSIMCFAFQNWHVGHRLQAQLAGCEFAHANGKLVVSHPSSQISKGSGKLQIESGLPDRRCGDVLVLAKESSNAELGQDRTTGMQRDAERPAMSSGILIQRLKPGRAVNGLVRAAGDFMCASLSRGSW